MQIRNYTPDDLNEKRLHGDQGAAGGEKRRALTNFVMEKNMKFVIRIEKDGLGFMAKKVLLQLPYRELLQQGEKDD